MDMDHVQAEGINLAWHHVQHGCYGPKGLFLLCTVLHVVLWVTGCQIANLEAPCCLFIIDGWCGRGWSGLEVEQGDGTRVSEGRQLRCGVSSEELSSPSFSEARESSSRLLPPTTGFLALRRRHSRLSRGKQTRIRNAYIRLTLWDKGQWQALVVEYRRPAGQQQWMGLPRGIT